MKPGASSATPAGSGWPPGGCLAVENWLLTPEGGIVHTGCRTAVIADVHLGYEWARAAAGDCVPAHSLAETTDRLERLLARFPVERLVVAGDLVEAVRPCRRTAREVVRLHQWLRDRRVRLVLLRGNHDGGLNGLIDQGDDALGSSGLGFQDALDVDGWTIVHGHAPVAVAVGVAGQGLVRKLVLGHHHPVLRLPGRSFRCFLASPRRILLPAFSGNAAGLDVLSARVPAASAPRSSRCLASSGEELLDFGPLHDLAARLRLCRADRDAPAGEAQRLLDRGLGPA